MGKHFGNLAHIRGMLYFEASQYEQKPFANAVKRFPNFYTRTRQTIWRWLPTFLIGYAVYRYVEYAHWAAMRKNPKDFMHEVEPPPPKMCRKPIEPLPFCKKDWQYDEYECAEGEEPNPEYFK